MAKKGGGSKRALITVRTRQENVLRYYLRGVGYADISRLLNVPARTISRDIKEIDSRVRQQIELAELYTLRRAFMELGEEWRESWILYHRAKEKVTREDGTVIQLDDTFRKLAALDRVHRIIGERARLAGFYSPKTLERYTMFETAAGRGIQIERLTFEEQLKRGVEELEHNEGLARSEGLYKSA